MSFIVNSSIGRKLVMSISGFALIFFLLFHMSMNFVAIIDDVLGTEGYNAICGFLGANWYAVVASMGLAFLVLVHFIYAIVLTIQNKKARGNQRYAYSKKPAEVEWASQNMFVLGLIVIGFMMLHLSQFWYKMQLNELLHVDTSVNPHDGSYLVIKTFQNPIMVALYVVWLVALWFHLTHGFWSAMQTIGINNAVWFNRWKVIGNVFTTIICLGFAFVAVTLYVQYGVCGWDVPQMAH